MTTSVLLALTGDDSELLRALVAPGSGLQVERRCGDVAELLAAAAAGLGQVAVIDTELDGVDLTALDRLRRVGVQCLLLAPSHDAARWGALGVPVESRAVAPQRLVGVLQSLKTPGSGGLELEPSDDIWPFLETSPLPVAPPGPQMPTTAPPLPSLQVDLTAVTPPEVGATGPSDIAGIGDVPGLGGSGFPDGATMPGLRPAGPQGRVVAVWGPTGAPGRSVIAASLALGLREAGEVLLVDADLEAPSLVQLLGMPEDSSALATAARLATHGGLDQQALDGLLTEVMPGVSLLSGLGRPGRWRELPPVSMDVVWSRCRERATWTVVDLPGGLAEDEVNELTLEPGRGAVVAELLARADVVLVVGTADPIGVRRLLQLLADSHTQGWRGRQEVVVNRVRASAAGTSPKWAVREALERFGGLEKVTLLPDDPALADRALLEGRAVLELAPGSELGRAIAELAALVDPAVAPGLRRSRRRRGGRSNLFGRCGRAGRKTKAGLTRPGRRGGEARAHERELVPTPAGAAEASPAEVSMVSPGLVAAMPVTGLGEAPAATGGGTLTSVGVVVSYGIMPGAVPPGVTPEAPAAEGHPPLGAMLQGPAPGACSADGVAPGGDTPRRRGGRHRL
ncbi:AAA family ATPase [Actinomyces trachealis]|uniref:AAA family ATPase n=1 Tax=Actinomyces trachealis TaxID=2763540 RepID=UPI0018C4BD22|nr:hypothetical protein [Actinomyces trachealis]